MAVHPDHPRHFFREWRCMTTNRIPTPTTPKVVLHDAA
jgi:hypothetical protein